MWCALGKAQHIGMIQIETNDGEYSYMTIEDGFTIKSISNDPKKEMVDLGLPSGTLWAKTNVGAEKPSDRGLHFFWGDTIPYVKGNLENNHELLIDGIGKTKFDVAYKLYGKNWRLPKPEELKELVECCKWEYTKIDGVDGYMVIGNNGNYIFLPDAHWYRLGSENLGLYYMSDCYNKVLTNAETGLHYEENPFHQSIAISIRPVYDESGDKLLSAEEYVRYNDDALFVAGKDSDIIITQKALDEFAERFKQYMPDEASKGIMAQYMKRHFNEHLSKELENYYKSHAGSIIECSDKSLYAASRIENDFINYITSQYSKINLTSAMNRYINPGSKMGDGLYTKNIKDLWPIIEECDSKYGVPGNCYLIATPLNNSAQPHVAFELPLLFAGINYDINITMAPETRDSIDAKSNQFRINMFYRQKSGSSYDWPNTKSETIKCIETGKNDFYSSGTECTTATFAKQFDVLTEGMLQIQAYVSGSDKTNTRQLRIAQIEIVPATDIPFYPSCLSSTDEDVNGDGVADTQDVLSIYEYMKDNTDSGTDPAFDVNHDNNVDTQDVLTIYEHMKSQAKLRKNIEK